MVSNLELIKKSILKEIESIIHDVNSAIDVNETLSIYFNLIQSSIAIPNADNLGGLEFEIKNSLEEIFVNGNTDAILIGNFCKNFEQFVKQIYYVLDSNGFIESDKRLDLTKQLTLLPFLSKLNCVRPYYLDRENQDVLEKEDALIEDGYPKFKYDANSNRKIYQRIYPSSISFDDYSLEDISKIDAKFGNKFLKFLVKAVLLKNEQSHQSPGRNRLENLSNCYNTLITELLLVNFFKRELDQSVKNESFANRDFGVYVASEIKRIEKQNSRYVSLNLRKFNTQIVDPVIGFIEDLLPLNNNRIRILGYGGSGKTTTLEYLLFKDSVTWIKNRGVSKVPVLISLANLSSHESIVLAISRKLNVEVDYVNELLQTNFIKIYLDGINEISDNRDSKMRKLQEISTLIDDYPEVSIILTDRYEFDSYQNNMFNIETFTIEKLNKDQFDSFIQNYCIEDNNQYDLVSRVLKTKTNIDELLSKPLILARAIEIIKVESSLPDKEGEIIEKFIEILLRREKDEKRDPLLHINNFKLLFAFVANEIYMASKSNIGVTEFTFGRYINDAAVFYGLEKFNSGYTIRIGYELEILQKSDNLISFFHQSYFEYFCSYFLKYRFQ